MRLNQYLAQRTNLSRRGADKEIEKGTVSINGKLAGLGATVGENDNVTWDGRPVEAVVQKSAVLFYKPVGVVCSRKGQGSRTIYELLPNEYRHLNPVGRLDKDSSGLLLLTNDGSLHQTMTHPRFEKQKIYIVLIDKPLTPLHHQMISDHGIRLSDGQSKLSLQKEDEQARKWRVTMSEGRNRQIRRTFAALGYRVLELQRIQFGDYLIGDLASGETREIKI